MTATTEPVRPIRGSAAWHLRAELGRAVTALAKLLREQRRRGRTPVGDAVDGLVIEDGEAEGLVAALAEAWIGGGNEGFAGVRSRTAPRREPEWFPFPDGDAHGGFLPLQHATRAFELTSAEYAALVLSLAVEVDARIGRLVGYLNDHVSRTRPTLGLVASLAPASVPEGPAFAASFASRPVVRDGLLELLGDGPAPGLSLRVSPAMLERLLATGEGPWRIGNALPPDPGLLDRIVLEEPVVHAANQWSERARARPARSAPVLLAGPVGSGRHTLAHAMVSRTGLSLVMARMEGRAPLEVLREARREARWEGAAVLIEWPARSPDATDWAVVWRELGTLAQPILMMVPLSEVERAAAAAPREPVAFTLSVPPVPHRVRIWRQLVPRTAPISAESLDVLATRFAFVPGRIVRVFRLATAAAERREPGARHLTEGDLLSACRSVGSTEMGTLAERVALPFTREDLVVPRSVATELDLAVAWVRHRKTVLEEWGFARRITMGRGLTALFTGKPGVGKTMAAQILARELSADLYKVDLSRVMSKYIGETEKNLSQLFDESQASGAVLFFDEADALFGKRTEVKDAHDRYANVEIGYLLTRMEEYDGVTILATNRLRDLDEAFVRRFQVLVQFPMPDAADRLRIWRGMLPAAALPNGELDLTVLAQRFELSGGEIRNVVMAAAYLAASAGERIGLSHLRRGLRRELSKNGRVPTPQELVALEDDSGR